MRLSLKNVFKKPLVHGKCSYSDQADSDPEVSDQTADEQQGNGVCAVETSEAQVYWSEERVPEQSLPGDKQRPDQVRDAKPDPGRAGEVQPAPQEPTEADLRRVEQILEDKMERCMREGYEQGKARAEDEYRALKEKAAALKQEAELNLREARQRAKEIVASSEHKIVELSIAVAERLVRTQLAVDADTITAIVRETMNLLAGGEQVELYVNPADARTCNDFSEQLKEEFRDIVRLDILTDENLARGSCRIESENGVAEYLIEEEQEQLKDTLLKLAGRDDESLAEEDSSYGKH